mmetsp:Transcript_34261/g.63054  ORF Transcript_34261/g.63054 Transcript_34261/m.63054 type:complete len:1066 (+) Transcript_34261:238-3435(+)
MRVIIESSCLVLLLHSFGVASAFQCHSLTSPLLSRPLHRHARSTVDAVARKQNVGSLLRNNIPRQTKQRTRTTLQMADSDNRPQAFATGYSTNPSLLAAIEEATNSALSSLPPATDLQYEIDLAIVVASSLYEEPSKIVPTLIKVVESSSGLYGYGGVKHLVGGTAGGVIGSRTAAGKGEEGEQARECQPIEAEATPAISVTLALLPDVELQTFHVDKEDVPEFDGDLTRNVNAVDGWKNAVGLAGFGSTSNEASEMKEEVDEETAAEKDEPYFMVIPSPAFQNSLDDFLQGLQFAFPTGQTFGGIASTVSSLSRARIFAYSAKNGAASSSSVPSNSVHGDGCVGVALQGDLRVDTMIAQGAKPVGGVYRVVAAGKPPTDSTTMKEDEASRSTIGAIVLDEAATVEDSEAKEYGDEDDEEERSEEEVRSAEEEKEAKRAKLLSNYAKARIPKPPLAEANFMMKQLSDDDQAFMRRALLIGLERGGGSMGIGRTPNELARLAKGEGHRFTVRQIASAGMKDGSVTFPLGSVNVNVGARCRFFVRDGEFAKKEVEALWTGYKKKELEGTLLGGEDMSPPTACLVLPTLDRGAKLFGGKTGYESGMVSDYMSGIPSISGFFANGVLGKLDGTIAGSTGGSANDNMLHGSSSQYVVFRSKTKRPFYSPQKAKEEAANAAALKAEEENAEHQLAAEDEKRTLMSKNFGSDSNDDAETSAASAAAPRSDNGELIVRRREIHSGRAMSVSSVEWSVAEKTAKPTSVLEGYMWEKETQVDRLRERVPLANLLSQTKAAMMNPMGGKPRDWIGPVKRAAGDDGNFVIVPECKRMEPVSGSLRNRYDLSKLVKYLTAAGAPAISVNSDGVLFGGTMEDVTKAREASNAAAVAESLDSSDGDGVVAPPVLASDLLLYPYQLYKLYLAGADAVTLVVGALESKDLVYLTKIANTIQLQVVASVTSEVQINMLSKLGPGSVVAMVISNRDLETFDFDNSGEQALALLRSDALKSFREKNDVPILVEGRVGIVEAADGGDSVAYIQALKDAGAFGAIVGGGMATVNEEDVAGSIVSWSL